jgi:hypothetical protein
VINMEKQAMCEAHDAFASREDSVVALARFAAGPLAMARYPVVEVLRTCALQTLPGSTSALRSPLNAIHASMHRWTHEDRTFVTPSNDFLYLNGWIDLTNGPVTLDIPPMEHDRYYVVELLDAFTNNFINLSPRNAGSGGARFVLHRPGEAPEVAGGEAVACPTALVWLLGRVLVKSEDDLARAQEIARAFGLKGPVCEGPSAARRWQLGGDPALDFFQNVFNSFADLPVQNDETAPVTMLAQLGISGARGVDVAALPAPVQRGLRLGYEDAQRLIFAFSESRTKSGWAYSLNLGRYGHAHLPRACVALKGIAALAAEEAVYASADFDDAGAHLDGGTRYVLHFPAGELPPVDAMWSLSLYGADRFFVDNPIRRYAIGDRTADLQYEADGGLRIVIQHDAPASTTNWLPAPAGRFYLILRLYHPRAAFLEGRYAIPGVQAISA